MHGQAERNRATPPQERRPPANKWAITLAVALGLAFLYVVRLAVLPFLIAAAVAFAADPAIEWLMGRVRVSRPLAGLIVFLLITFVVGGAFFLAFRPLGGELHHVLQDLPELIARLLRGLFGGNSVKLFGHELRADQIADQAARDLVATFAHPERLLAFGLYGFAALTGAVLLVVLIFFFLRSGPELADSVLWLVPPEYRDEVREVAGKIVPMLRRYLLGLFAIFVFASVVTWAVLSFALQLPFPGVLGVTTGALELIPVIGPAASATLIGLLSIEQHGIWALIVFAAYVTGFRLAIDRLLGPLILGAAVRLHPVIIMFSMLSGGLVLGIIGVILAVPVAATVKIVLQHYYSHPTRGSQGRTG